jgi:hypothetical protein
MSQPASRSDIAKFCVIFGGFVCIVALGFVLGGADRGLGVALTLVGLAAVVWARSLSDAKQSIGERLPLWPGRNTLRPFTVRLWGTGVLVLGLLMAIGV